MDARKAVLSPPTLLLALGRECAAIAAQARGILCRADPRRETILGLVQADVQIESSESQAWEAKLEQATHALRLHENLIRVGLGDEPDLPLGLILLADLTDPSSDRLYPLLDVLKRSLVHESNSYAFLLLKTAAFDSNPAETQRLARLHLHLQRLQSESAQTGWTFHIYLFDRYKEGNREAKDDREIDLLMGNFMLALLSGRFAEQVGGQVPAVEAGDRKAYFGSAGVTALLYDPLALREHCASRLGAEVLEFEFLDDAISDLAAVVGTTAEISQRLGERHDWETALCADMPCQPVREEPANLDLPLANLEFEGLPIEEWGDEITGYAGYFENALLPPLVETLDGNAIDLARRRLQGLDECLASLPCQAALYPGVISNVSRVIQNITGLLKHRQQDYLPVAEADKAAASLDSAYKSALEILDKAVSAMPKPPRWVARLPRLISSIAQTLYDFVFHRKEYRQLLVLRERAVQALAGKLAFPLEQEMRRRLGGLCGQCLTALNGASEALARLHSILQKNRAEILMEPVNFPQGHSPFRIYLSNPTLMDWAYERSTPPLEKLRTTLLEEGFLQDWQIVTEEELRARLLEACRTVFQDLEEIPVEESLRHWDGENLGDATTMLVQGAVPSLQPNFDLEGDGSSYQVFYLLCNEPHASGLAEVLKKTSREWQMMDTGDPNLALFCRIRQLVSVKSLDGLARRAKAAFEKLGKEERKALQDSIEAVERKEQT
ncbi:MAG: hypothetical protein AB1750_09640 [Chloroflexota bacterium]